MTFRVEAVKIAQVSSFNTLQKDELMDIGLYDQLLFDYYGTLLTEKQQFILELYYEDNLTLSEIAEKTRTSRQAVHDTLKRSHKALEKFEKQLGLIEADRKRDRILTHIIKILNQLRNQESIDSDDRRLMEVLDLLVDLKKG